MLLQLVPCSIVPDRFRPRCATVIGDLLQVGYSKAHTTRTIELLLAACIHINFMTASRTLSWWIHLFAWLIWYYTCYLHTFRLLFQTVQSTLQVGNAVKVVKHAVRQCRLHRTCTVDAHRQAVRDPSTAICTLNNVGNRSKPRCLQKYSLKRYNLAFLQFALKTSWLCAAASRACFFFILKVYAQVVCAPWSTTPDTVRV